MARPVEKRKFIEEGVVRVVAEKGLRGTTIQDIAEAANVSPGLLYRYWKNRDDLAGEVYRTHSLALLGQLSILAASEPDVPSRLRVMLDAFLHYADEHPILLKFLLLSQHDLSHNLSPEQNVHAFVRRLVQEGMAEGSLAEMDVNVAASMLLGLVLQPAIASVYGQVSNPVREHVPAIMRAIEGALARRDSAGRQVCGSWQVQPSSVAR